MKRARRRIFLPLVISAWLLAPVRPTEARLLSYGVRAAAAPEEAAEGKGESRELLYKIINFTILVVALGIVLRKPAAEFFSQRSAAIRKALDEGRHALEASQAQLAAVEEKLRYLEEEIAAFKASATREMETERQRLRQSTAEEAEKILESARARIDSATRGAKLELKNHAAEEALKLAEQMIRERLDDAGRRRFVSQYIARLDAKESKN